MSNYVAAAEINTGVYLARIVDVFVGNAKSSGNPTVQTVLELKSGSLAGKLLRKCHMLTSVKGREQCLKEWKQLGYALTHPQDLLRFLEELKGLFIKIRIEQGNSPSCYLMGRATEEEVPGYVGKAAEPASWERVILDGHEMRSQVVNDRPHDVKPERTVVVREPAPPLNGKQPSWQQDLYEQLSEVIQRLPSK